MADLRLVFAAATGQFERFTEGARHKMATASMGAINDAANYIKNQGRANISSAGFSKKWQNAFRVNVYPDKGKRVSIHPALIAWHKIPYAGIFEEGGRITGSPFLWLPLPGVPKRINGKHMSPKNYERFVGKLFRYKAGTTRIPLLGGYMPAGSRGGGRGAITISALKRGMSSRGKSGGKVVPVPLFFGISTVSMRKRFNMKEIFKKANQQLPQYYLNNFRR